MLVDLSGWWTVLLFWIFLFLAAYLFLMASLSVMDYVPWKSWFRSLIGMEDPAGGGDHNTQTGRSTTITTLNPLEHRRTGGRTNHSIGRNVDQLTNKNAENLRIFGYQQAGRVEETLIYPLTGHDEVGSSSESADSLTGGSMTTSTTDTASTLTLPTRMSLHGDLGFNSYADEDNKDDAAAEQALAPRAKTFIKWVPFKEGVQNQRFESFLDREDRPRGVLAWELASHEHVPRSKSSICFADNTEVVSPVRLTISDSALGMPFFHFGSSPPAGGGGGDKHSLRRVHCDPNRFEYHRNRRYISTLLRDGVSMKATLYLQLPSKPDSSRCNMKTDLILVLLKSFLWPWEDVHITWVPSLLTWLVTILTANTATPVFRNQVIRSNYKAVLLLSKEAARQVRHQDMVFLFNLAMLLQTSPEKVLLLQQVN